MNTSDIHKAAGILIIDRKLLVSREQGKTVFTAPGGKVDPAELVEQALIRELAEEFAIKVSESDFEEFGHFEAPAAGQEHRRVKMDVFIVLDWKGEPAPHSEVEEIRWVTSDFGDLPLGSIFAHEVIPRLKARDLID